MAAGQGLVHIALHPKGVAQLSDRLADLEHVGAGQLERFVSNPDACQAPQHPHIVLAGNLS